MERVLNYLKENPVFYFATVEGDEPKVRPFGFYMGYEGKLYFAVGDFKPTYRQLQGNPKFEVSTAAKDYTWIRIKGKAVFDSRSEVLEKVFETTPMLKDMYGKEGGPSLAVFYVEDGEAVIADMKGNQTVITL